MTRRIEELMSKISNDVIKNFIKQNPTSKEIDFLLYLARYQDADGICRGIYYKDVMEAIDCCKQSFYSIKKSLENKGIIKIERESNIDYDIAIIGNQDNWQNGYLNARKPVLHTQDFKELPAGAKMIAMDLIIITDSNGGVWDISKDKFYERYMNFLPFKIKKKTLREYIRLLRGGIKWDEAKKIKKPDKNKGILIFKVAYNKERDLKFCILKRHLKNAERPEKLKTDNEVWTEHFVATLCRRNKINTGHKNVRDTADLIMQYQDGARQQGKSICRVLIRAFNNALERLQKNIINPKLIHKYVRYELYSEPITF